MIGHMTDFLRRHHIGALAVLLAFAADQLTKLSVVRALAVGESWPESGLFQLTRAVNTGSAFGLFGGYNTLLVLASVGGIVALLAFYGPHQRPGIRAQLSFGLLFAGIAGNLVDRVVIGHVTDFIDVVPWCIFNLADVSVVMGVIIFACAVPTARTTRWKLH